MRLKINLVGELIGLDLGKSRTGVARMNTYARIPEPLEPIDMKDIDTFIDTVQQLVRHYEAVCIVAGVPRGLNGQETEQTTWARSIIAQLDDMAGVPVFSVDEAGTTKAAEKRAQSSQSIDSVAAGIIAEDFLDEAMRGNIEGVYVQTQ